MMVAAMSDRVRLPPEDAFRIAWFLRKVHAPGNALRGIAPTPRRLSEFRATQLWSAVRPHPG